MTQRGAHPSFCSWFGAEKRRIGERSSASLFPDPGPYLHRHLDGTWPRPGQWGQHEPGGCGQCGQQPSHVEPGHCPWKCRRPPTPPIKEDMRGCFGGWGVCTRMWNGSGGIPGVRRRGQRQQQMAKMGPGNAHPWQSGADLSHGSPARGGPSGHLRQPRPRWLSWSWVRPERALLTEETVEAPRVMRMRPLSSKRVVLLQAPGPWGVGGRV